MFGNKIIDAEDLLQAIRDDISINGTNFAKVKRHIEDAPAVDAVEAVHAVVTDYVHQSEEEAIEAWNRRVEDV